MQFDPLEISEYLQIAKIVLNVGTGSILWQPHVKIEMLCLNLEQESGLPIPEKHLPIGFVAGVGDLAFPFATEPLAIAFPSTNKNDRAFQNTIYIRP